MTPVELTAFDDASLVREYLRDPRGTGPRLGGRLRCVARILRAQNAKLGRPLDEHDLADLVQDTVMVILRKLGQYVDGGDLEAWVFQICRFELMNSVRRKRRNPLPLGLDLDRPTARSVDRSAGDPPSDVLAGLSKLDDEEAAVVRLKYFDDLSFPEISARLGIPLGTSKTRHYRGMLKLSQFLQGRGDGGAS